MGVSTSTVRSHLNTQHSVVVPKVSTESSANDANPSTSTTPTEKSKTAISAFFIPRDTPASVAANLCAVDRMSYNVVASSKQIHLGQRARGISLPQTASGVRNAVFNFCNETKTGVKAEISKKVEAGKRFSISVDEYTSTKNRRYMCLNLHGQDSEVIGLGMIRVQGSLPAEKAVQLTRKKLEEFGLSVENHIAGVVSDGASVMIKYARLLGIEHQICHSHGLHLAVCDVLYKKTQVDNNGCCKGRMIDSNDNNIDNDNDSDDD